MEPLFPIRFWAMTVLPIRTIDVHPRDGRREESTAGTESGCERFVGCDRTGGVPAVIFPEKTMRLAIALLLAATYNLYVI